ncbi:MAG: hypothetical protein R3C49_16600 [Planctomycetaceae bacterium]
MTPASVTERVIQDLQRVRSWNLLWKVASAFGENSETGTRSRLSLRAIRKAANADRDVDIGIASPGTEFEVRLHNRRFEPVWYSVFFLNGQYGIEFVSSGTIRGRKALGEDSASVVVDQMKLNSDTTGVEGYVAIGVPLDGNRAEPNFRFLAQPAIGEARSRSPVMIPERPTLFEQTLVEAARAGNAVRSGVSSDDAEVTSISWVTSGQKP